MAEKGQKGKTAKARKAPMKEIPGPVTRELKKEEITIPVIKKARKAELVEFCKQFGLESEGKVDELRGRLIEHLERPAEVVEEEITEVEPELEEEIEEEVEIEEVEEEAEEKVEIEEEEEEKYVPKLKPKLSDEMRERLLLRKKFASKRPDFRRQEWFRYKRLGIKWRRPRGLHSKLRRHLKYRINVVSIGFRGPVETRGLHPSGFKEVLVHNPHQVEDLDPSTHAVRIAHAVGMRKRKMIEEAADERGLRVLNRSGAGES